MMVVRTPCSGSVYWITHIKHPYKIVYQNTNFEASDRGPLTLAYIHNHSLFCIKINTSETCQSWGSCSRGAPPSHAEIPDRYCNVTMDTGRVSPLPTQGAEFVKVFILIRHGSRAVGMTFQ